MLEIVSAIYFVLFQLIDFDRLDFGETKTLDTFYNADIALIDFTITHQQPSLCYHVGVRESMGQNYNIIIMYFPDEKAEVRIMEALKVCAYFTSDTYSIFFRKHYHISISLFIFSPRRIRPYSSLLINPISLNGCVKWVRSM